MPKKSSENAMFEMLIAAARGRGWKVKKIPVEVPMAEATKGRHRTYLYYHVPVLNTHVAQRLATNKYLTSTLLRRAGVPVPEFASCTSIEEARAAAKRIGFPLVVKPLKGSLGKGVTLNIRTHAALEDAVKASQRYATTFLVERYCLGKDLRVFTLDGRVLGAVERRAPAVTGDGASTVAALADAFERARVEKLGQGVAGRRALLRDAHFRGTLKSQGLTPKSVPAKGRVVQLRRSSDLSKGGTAHALARIPAAVRRGALAAAATLGLRYSGVDMLVEDDGRFVINEVNGSPMFALHQYPDEGAPQDVLGPLVDAILLRP